MSTNQRIAIVGANGKIGFEVTMLLKAAGCDIVPICRGRRGSAALRYLGIPVRHGSIASAADAPRLIGDAAVVINFALPIGVPAHSRTQNRAIIENCFVAAPQAKLIFCSTMVTHKGFHAEDQPKGMTQYGREKRTNADQIRSLERAHDHPAITVRLGHVAGATQPISVAMRELIARGPVSLPYPERHANILHCLTIADMVRRAASEQWFSPGLWDLVDQPGLSWRRAFELEAALANLPVELVDAGLGTGAPASMPLIRQVARQIARIPALRQSAERVLANLPERYSRQARLQHLIAQNAAETAALRTTPPQLDALTYPGIVASLPPGLRDLDAILSDQCYRLPQGRFGPGWPEDLPPA
jgi:nucleoside-diphosphate-sugar epimerase